MILLLLRWFLIKMLYFFIEICLLAIMSMFSQFLCTFAGMATVTQKTKIKFCSKNHSKLFDKNIKVPIKDQLFLSAKVHLMSPQNFWTPKKKNSLQNCFKKELTDSIKNNIEWYQVLKCYKIIQELVTNRHQHAKSLSSKCQERVTNIPRACYQHAISSTHIGQEFVTNMTNPRHQHAKSSSPNIHKNSISFRVIYLLVSQYHSLNLSEGFHQYLHSKS